MTRQIMRHRPGVICTVTTESPERALDGVVQDLVRERYNSVTSDRHFSTELGERPLVWTRGVRTKLHVRENGTLIGHVAIIYQGTTTDRSVPAEPRTAQRFDVYFNLDPYKSPNQKRSYEERDVFAGR